MATWHQSQKVEHGCTATNHPLSNGIKIVSLLQRLHGKTWRTNQGRSYIWGNRGGRLGCFQDYCLSENNITSTIFSLCQFNTSLTVHNSLSLSLPAQDLPLSHTFWPQDWLHGLYYWPFVLSISVFTARRSYASAVLSVRPSACLSHACFVTNAKNIPTIFLYHTKGQSFQFSDAKDLGEIPNGAFRPISVYISQTVQNTDMVTMER